ncbi:MAG TPA: hypothetical protein VLL52_00420 [Anaerolineae bacterium]|nr:hypothetical protein [Anaerolineae bacterium]
MMLQERLVDAWLRDSDELFEKQLKRFTLVYLVALLPWAAGMWFLLIMVMVSMFDGGDFFFYLSLGTMVMYPVVLVPCLLRSWSVWRHFQNQRRVMGTIWWPLAPLFLTLLLLLTRVPFMIRLWF